MANARRGEIPAELGGREVKLWLTLGGLAELEHGLGAGDLAALGERLGRGRIAAREVMLILRCASAEPALDAAAIDALPASELPACLDAVARLLDATFGGVEPAPRAMSPSSAGEGGGSRPFA